MKHLYFAGILLAAALFGSTSVAAQEPILLWPNGAPGAVGEEDQDRPTLTPHLAEKDIATGAAVVVCPGGGYGVLATDHEGTQVAKWFNSIGVSAFVLKYRLGQRYRHPAPLNDVQRAIRYVRLNASSLSISPKRVGVMGFSAGGHLASTVATHFDDGDKSASDPIDRQSCRPSFAILGYPVVSFSEPFGHAGSRRNLMGPEPDPKLVESLSNEKQVTAETPPTFLFHTAEDTGVPPDNSLSFFQALRKAGVPAELHVYQFGPHGVGLAHGDPAVHSWVGRLHDWMKTSGFLADVQRAAVSGMISVDGKPLRWGSIAFVPQGTNQPVAWAMINQGKFSVPVHRGAVVGEVVVEIRNLGSVEPRATIPDVQLFDKKPKVQIANGPNQLEFNLAGK